VAVDIYTGKRIVKVLILNEDLVYNLIKGGAPMKRLLIYLIVFPVFLLMPLLLWGGEVYKWIDEKGTVHLTDDKNQIPEKYSDQTETIPVPDKYAEPSRPSEEIVYPSISEPEKPRAKEPEPPSEFVSFEKFIHIKEGMSEAEVLSRLGPPTREVADEIETSGSRGGRSFLNREALVKRYYYIGNSDLGERTTVIHFKNGVVEKIERIFPPTW
jgi:hypothetical protein